MSREEFLLRHRDSFIFYIDDEALQRVVISIQKLDKKSNDYKILYKVGQNLKNDQIASDLGVASNNLSDQLSEICELIRIPKINFKGPRRTGIYRRIVIQKAFLLIEEMQ